MRHVRSLAGTGCVLAVVGSVGCDSGATPSVEKASTSLGCPARMVRLSDPDTCIDRYEAFVDERGVARPARGKLPERRCSHDDAARACGRAGFRLCTGAEWTRACAGPDAQRVYPYGNEYAPGRCNTAEEDTRPEAQKLLPGGARSGCVTPEGIYDLSGNAFEWTSEPDESGLLREIRGGSFGVGERNVKCVRHAAIYQPPDTPIDGMGFRCCSDLKPPQPGSP